jgi:hypothetical protein
MQKKLGIFSYPLVRGERVQDLEVNAIRYPILIFFEGENHDLEAENFFQSCKQRGLWEIVHPVKGTLFLQMVSVTESIQPVEDANRTAITLEFIEPLQDEALVSDTELQGLSASGLDQMNSKSATSLATKINTAAARGRAAITSVTNKITTSINTVMAPLYAGVAAAQSIMDGAQSAIQETINAVVFEPLAFAGQVKTLMQTPALAVADTKARLSSYRDLATEIFEIENLSLREDGVNTAIVKEAFLVGMIGALSIIATTSSDIETRTEAIDAADDILNLFDDIVDNLDEHQTQFEDLTVDKQYFSQSDIYPDTLRQISYSLRYLLQAIADLKIEKRITLKEKTPPILIAMKEYGGPGDGDVNFDFFIKTNNLKKDEILLLPAGREVRVYV